MSQRAGRWGSRPSPGPVTAKHQPPQGVAPARAHGRAPPGPAAPETAAASVALAAPPGGTPRRSLRRCGAAPSLRADARAPRPPRSTYAGVKHLRVWG
ncbi:MAG: hypothetical protein ACE5Q6_08410, partial [Dehalococcoidia bacterium]